jgi:hypothetical protein
MKQITRILIVVLFLVIVDISCKDDEPFYSINQYETNLNIAVNKYRKAQGLDTLLFFHDVFVEAREQSIAWKKSGDPSDGMDARIQTIIDHWEPTNLGVITSKAYAAHSDSAFNVVNSWKNDSSTNAILIDEFTHASPGIATGANGEVYITHFFLNLPY